MQLSSLIYSIFSTVDEKSRDSLRHYANRKHYVVLVSYWGHQFTNL